jgi:hypothetical protein
LVADFRQISLIREAIFADFQAYSGEKFALINSASCKLKAPFLRIQALEILFVKISMALLFSFVGIFGLLS